MSDWSFGWLAASKTYRIDLSQLTGAYKKSPPISRWCWFFFFFTLPNTFLKLPRIFPLPEILCCVQVPAEQQLLLLFFCEADFRNIIIGDFCLLLIREISTECNQQVNRDGTSRCLQSRSVCIKRSSFQLDFSSLVQKQAIQVAETDANARPFQFCAACV